MKFTNDYIDINGKVYFYDAISALPRTKENAFLYAAGIICKSWTFARLTAPEKVQLVEALMAAKTIGNFNQRLEQYYTIQHAFLLWLDYKPIGWREEPVA